MALGGDPKTINPQYSAIWLSDHSVIADEAGCAGALQKNMELEFDRNKSGVMSSSNGPRNHSRMYVLFLLELAFAIS